MDEEELEEEEEEEECVGSQSHTSSLAQQLPPKSLGMVRSGYLHIIRVIIIVSCIFSIHFPTFIRLFAVIHFNNLFI